MYSQDSHKSDHLSEDGYSAYRQFQEIYKLEAMQRQIGNSESQQQFKDLLYRLRDGESTQSDWELLMTRTSDNVTEAERKTFSDAINILTTWEKMNKINLNKIRSLNQPVAKMHAVYTGGSEASKADSKTAKGLETEVLLCRKARVMLTANI
jgi:hypothetical protein